MRVGDMPHFADLGLRSVPGHRPESKIAVNQERGNQNGETRKTANGRPQRKGVPAV